MDTDNQDQTVSPSPDLRAADGEQPGEQPGQLGQQEQPKEQLKGIAVDGTPQKLHPRSLTLQRIEGWIRAAILSAMMLVGVSLLILVQPPLLVQLALLLVFGALVLGLIWLAQCWPAISYRYRSYSLDELGIEIRRGVIFRRVITVPRSRVQHTDVNQGPIERRLGLAHLVIHTAGTANAEVTLSGLGFDTALQIRSHLLASGSGDAV